MNRYTRGITAALVGAVFTSTAPVAQVPTNPAHTHIAHVMTSWKETPEMKGFLAVWRVRVECARSRRRNRRLIEKGIRSAAHDVRQDRRAGIWIRNQARGCRRVAARAACREIRRRFG